MGRRIAEHIGRRLGQRGQTLFANLKGTQHIAMPLIIEIDGDTAYVRVMLHAQYHLPNVRGGPVQTMIGYYDNWLVRTEMGWKITKMVQTITWNEGNWYIVEKAAGLSE
ncbi:nuclear transport factor 2 family protein [Roseobacter sp. MH60115]|uniref:nuclear transport factor 2 family protein n=1 Tax=Roseobacter sp. MH60115 TaxID=2785324 RepID=UPI0018A31AD6|nr:nuclear transport factor 2 family protein [Roseobacter sp. MH60115]